MTDLSQNDHFTDKYFSGIPIDISKCLIIFSYNDVSKVDKILLDRIHRIKINAMNKYEKVRVMIDYVYSQILKSIGFKPGDILLEDTELIYIIDTYTCEPGIRKLKEKVFELFREVNLRYLL
jgi:ATP-dependent Lon protease